mmetsp:Transcript_13867/g.24805  ORF Transcript_13867/g.24805 Transcript_13867/m.24805 type:complete len:712 (+) Transcript_13867:107-2242(+)
MMRQWARAATSGSSALGVGGVRHPRWNQVLIRGMAGAAQDKLFDKVLIANRGEIACRVMKTCRSLGIKTVAVFSEPDRYSMHVQMADEAICVGPAASAESYLNIPKIMEAIDSTGAQAVHPGYGFLSENHLFAEALEEKGVAFIGPGSYAITSMGDKVTSKRIAAEAGVNTIPGSLALVETDDQIKQMAAEIGYPVMIKASAGGGGKGMRIAWNDEEAIEGFKLSRDEAKASFGDDRIFMEKFIEEPRHIEIQLIADKHGNVCALPERECSIQRRNQKVLEEAPSTFLDPETRRKMQDQAIQLAKAVDYCSAGTVEMLVDKHKNHYFLEMNTRLQVEHPVTELVGDVDLVEQMIRVAAGHKLPDDLLDRERPINGWAHEARVYAEDPIRGFLPSTGRLIEYVEPTTDIVDGVRVDTGIRPGDEISMFYDPMVSKLVTHGKDRAEALDRLEQAIDNYVVQGLGNNLNFLRACTRNERFRSGEITTNFIPEEFPDGFHGVQLSLDEEYRMVALTLIAYSTEANSVASISGKVRETDHPDHLYFKIKDRVYIVGHTEEGSIVIVDPKDTDKALAEFDVGSYEQAAGEVLLRAELSEKEEVAQIHERTPRGFRVQYAGAVEEVSIFTPDEFSLNKHMLEKPEIDWGKWLRSPMPGALVQVDVAEGDKVFAGQALAVVEAMKMQNVLRAERNGVVKKVYCEAGATLQVDEPIIEFE